MFGRLKCFLHCLTAGHVKWAPGGQDPDRWNFFVMGDLDHQTVTKLNICRRCGNAYGWTVVDATLKRPENPPDRRSSTPTAVTVPLHRAN